MAATLEQRLEELHESLGQFKPTDHPSWQLGQIFNALLAAVKEANGDDPVAAAIEPVQQSMLGQVTNTDCGTMRAATMMLRGAVRDD